jgi:adenylate cyclase
MFQLRSFRARLLAFVLPLLIGALAGALILTDIANTTNARSLISAQLETDANRLTRAIDERSTHLLDSARLLASDFAFKRAFALGDAVTLESAIENHLGRISEADLMLVADLDGRLVAGVGLIGDDQDAYVRLASAALNDAYGEAAGILFLADRPHQMVVTPLLAPDVVAWVLVGFELDDRFVNAFRSGTQGEISLIVSTGGVARVQASTLEPPQREALRAAWRGTDLTADMALIGDVQTTSVIRPLEVLADAQLEVVLQRSMDDALAPYQAVRRLLLLLFAGALAASLVGAVLIARSISRPVTALSEAARAVEEGDLSQRVAGDSGDEIGRLAQRFNAMVGGLQDRDRTRDLLGKVVSRQVAEELLSHEIELGGEERECTILFSDLRGFTSLCEGRSPVEILALLNRYFSRMTAVVDTHGGVVDKFIGDALMALYGVPVAAEDHAQRAVESALGMQVALTELNNELGLTTGPFTNQIRIGIGLATGEVVAGNMGSTERLNYTVIGDAVNLSARLEGLSKNYCVSNVIADATWEAAGQPLALELDRVRVQGQTEVHRVRTLLHDEDASEAFRDAYRVGFALEQAGRWTEATAAWKSTPASPACAGLVAMRSERCQRYATDPPPDWEGISTWGK